ncbi:MAG: prenyltransferase, partial [Candidatus Gastranaerophilales bacterium]|nr:prenyltransferase [Candidatus Gastranaerophilales bacterium]
IKYQKNEFNLNAKARLIKDGSFSIFQVEKILFWIFLPAFLTGVYFICLRGCSILFYMVLGALLGAFYPVSSKYGLSELTIGIIFGPVLINGVYTALTGNFNPAVFNFSICSGIITSILLVVHSLMDYEYDLKSGKKTVPVMLKSKNLTITLIAIMIFSAFALAGYTSMKYNLGLIFLLPVIAVLPVSFKLILSLDDYINVRDIKFTPKWYFGVMENWDDIVKNNIAYFMFRFYLARNLTVIFNVCLAAASLYMNMNIWNWYYLF